MDTHFEQNVTTKFSNIEQSIYQEQVGLTSGKKRWFNIFGTIKSLIILTDLKTL